MVWEAPRRFGYHRVAGGAACYRGCGRHRGREDAAKSLIAFQVSRGIPSYASSYHLFLIILSISVSVIFFAAVSSRSLVLLWIRYLIFFSPSLARSLSLSFSLSWRPTRWMRVQSHAWCYSGQVQHKHGALLSKALRSPTSSPTALQGKMTKDSGRRLREMSGFSAFFSLSASFYLRFPCALFPPYPLSYSICRAFFVAKP